eukprot:4212927-Pyramimonas_sp.AAC.1
MTRSGCQPTRSADPIGRWLPPSSRFTRRRGLHLTYSGLRSPTMTTVTSSRMTRSDSKREARAQ